MNKIYRYLHNETVGWLDIDEPGCTGLTEEQCKVRLEELVQEGYNPNHLRLLYDA